MRGLVSHHTSFVTLKYTPRSTCHSHFPYPIPSSLMCLFVNPQVSHLLFVHTHASRLASYTTEPTVTNCSFGNPRVVGSSLGHTIDRVVGEAQLYLGGYRRISQRDTQQEDCVRVRSLYRMIQRNKGSIQEDTDKRGEQTEVHQPILWAFYTVQGIG